MREYPELRDAIAKGQIHLTGVLMIGPHLGGERHAEILQRARFRSKRMEESADSASENAIATSADPASEDGSAYYDDAEEHAPPLYYKVQFTANQTFVDLLEEAKALLGHETPRATLAEIQVLALRALVQQLRTRKRAATKVRPVAPPPGLQVGRNPALARVVTDSANAAPARLVTNSPDAAPARRGSRHIPASVGAVA